jgi:hypothetical protein
MCGFSPIFLSSVFPPSICPTLFVFHFPLVSKFALYRLLKDLIYGSNQGSIFRPENDIYSPPSSDNEIFPLSPTPRFSTPIMTFLPYFFPILQFFYAFTSPFLIFFPVSSFFFPLSSFFFYIFHFFSSPAHIFPPK